MKKYCITMCIVATLIFTGCSKGESTFDKAMSEGKMAIASQEYEKAEGMFDLAIQENKDDKEANNLYNQTVLLIEAKELIEDDKFKEAEAKLKKLKSIDSNLDTLKKEADKLLEDIKVSSNTKEPEKDLEYNKEEINKEESNKEEIKSTKNDNKNKTLCSCGKNYLEDNEFWKGEDKCDDCINEVVNAHADNYSCVICGNKTELLCEYDQCEPLCPDDMGYYCDCGEYHHTQNLCPIYDV